MKDNEAVNDEPAGIMDAINELWNKAKTDDALTTSQRMRPILPDEAEKYHQLKQVGVKMDRILAILEQDRQERTTTKTAVKRGVMQILKGIGWIE
jgi:hypothetical protein